LVRSFLCILITLISFPLFGAEIVPNWRDDLVAEEYEAFNFYAQQDFSSFSFIDRRVPHSHPNLFQKILALDPKGASIHFDNNLIWMVHPSDQARVKKWEQNDVYLIAISDAMLGLYHIDDLAFIFWAPVFHAINYTKRDSALVYLDFIPDSTQTKTLKISKIKKDLPGIDRFFPTIQLNEGKPFTIDIYPNPRIEDQKALVYSWEVNDRVLVLMGNRVWGGDNELFNLDKRRALRVSYYNFQDGY